jgi:hypothetical protein
MAGVALMAMAACGGSPSPTTPSATRSAQNASSSVTAVSVSTAGGTSIADGSVADFARCLQSSGDAACFAGARPVTRVATAGATAPGAPGNLLATAGGGTVSLTWSAPTSGDPVVTYVVEAGSASGLSNLAVVTTNSTATTFSAGGVGNGTYYIRIKAQNATGTSAASNEATLVVCTSAPGAPTGLTTSVSGSAVTIRWNAASGGCAATSYLLQAGSTAGSSGLANSNIGNVTSYVAAGVGAGVYYIRVVAVNGFGQSAASNEVATTVGSTTTTGGGLTGAWIGLAPDGFVIDAATGSCDIETDVQMDLTQTGNALTGSFTERVRRVSPLRPGCDTVSNTFGSATPFTGSVIGTTMILVVPGDHGGPPITFRGMFTDRRFVVVPDGYTQSQASLTLNRQ